MAMNSVFQIESDEDFQKITNKLINNLFIHQTITTECGSEVLEQAKIEFMQLLTSNDFDMNNIAAVIKDKNWDEKKVAYFLKVLLDKKSKLLVAVLQNHNSTHGELITDFSWKIKLILGTSELKTLKYPIMQLLFAVYYKGEHKKMACDASLNVLSKLINDLENLNITV